MCVCFVSVIVGACNFCVCGLWLHVIFACGLCVYVLFVCADCVCMYCLCVWIVCVCIICVHAGVMDRLVA